MTARSRVLPLVLVGAAVLALLLVPRHVDLPIAWLSSSRLLGDAVDGGTPLWWLLEDLANIAMFVPVEWVLARLLRPTPAVFGGTALSAVCELAQHWIPNRDGSVLDLTMNAIGTALGVAVAVYARRRQARRASPQMAQDQYGRVSDPATSMGVRQRPQLGVSSDASSSVPMPTATW